MSKNVKTPEKMQLYLICVIIISSGCIKLHSEMVILQFNMILNLTMKVYILPAFNFCECMSVIESFYGPIIK